jgi:hypothetical protein
MTHKVFWVYVIETGGFFADISGHRFDKAKVTMQDENTYEMDLIKQTLSKSINDLQSLAGHVFNAQEHGTSRTAYCEELTILVLKDAGIFKDGDKIEFLHI